MKKYTKVWGEHISLKELIVAVIISFVILIVALLIERQVFNDKNMQLLFGLVAIIIAFFINVLIFKPKRKISINEEKKDDN